MKFRPLIWKELLAGAAGEPDRGDLFAVFHVGMVDEIRCVAEHLKCRVCQKSEAGF
jgi:hypothetical protein